MKGIGKDTNITGEIRNLLHLKFYKVSYKDMLPKLQCLDLWTITEILSLEETGALMTWWLIKIKTMFHSHLAKKVCLKGIEQLL
jgi:hypothetical protein